MNWVGGARNRVKGTHKNELRLQKEFFERKRLEQLNHPAQVGNGETNREKPKKSKVSQDIISFQRQCRMNNRQGINTTSNFRRVDLNSRSYSKGVNKFGVNAVELPMSPIDRPSMLHLSSPPSRPTLFRHGPIPHCNSRAAATSSMNQSSCLDLFGEPTLKPHASITNQLKQVNHGTFNNKASTDTTATNEPYCMQVPYRPREKSRDFPSQPSPESEYGRETHTVPSSSFYTTMFNNDLSSLYDCSSACHQCHKHKEPDFSHSSCYQVEPHFDLNTTRSTCDDSTQPLFGEKKKKTKFSVRIVPSPESQVSLSSETSTLNNWSQTNDARISDRNCNHLELQNEREYSVCNSGQSNYSGLYEPNAPAQWQQQQQTSRWPPHMNEQNSCSEQTHMTTIKDTHHGHRIYHRPQIRTHYNRQATESFPTPESNYCDQAPSRCYVVSSGLDSTPNTSYHRPASHASPLSYGQGEMFQKAGLNTNRDVHTTALVRLEPCQKFIQCEDPTKSFNPEKQVTKSTLNSLRSPVERPTECKKSNTSTIHSTGSTSFKADENKIVRGTTHSQVSVAATPSCKSTNLNDDTILTQDISIHELQVEKNALDNRNSLQVLETLSADLDKCKGLIAPRCDIRDHGHVTSSADGVTNISQTKAFTDISNPIDLSISTQTTPKVFKDTASSPIKEVVGKPTVLLSSYVVEDSLISSSVYNVEQYQTVQS